jgi:hypothetical protein
VPQSRQYPASEPFNSSQRGAPVRCRNPFFRGLCLAASPGVLSRSKHSSRFRVLQLQPRGAPVRGLDPFPKRSPAPTPQVFPRPSKRESERAQHGGRDKSGTYAIGAALATFPPAAGCPPAGAAAGGIAAAGTGRWAWAAAAFGRAPWAPRATWAPWAPCAIWATWAPWAPCANWATWAPWAPWTIWATWAT